METELEIDDVPTSSSRGPSLPVGCRSNDRDLIAFSTDIFSGKDRKRHISSPESSPLSSPLDSLRIRPDVVYPHNTPGLWKFRRRISSEPKINYFAALDMPPFVMTEIFSYLNKRDLMSAMSTCRYFYDMGVKSKNWDFLDLSKKHLNANGFLNIVVRRVKVLRMCDASISLDTQPLIEIPFLWLTHLDMGRVTFEHGDILIHILNKCNKLQALSLEAVSIQGVEDELCFAIAKNKNLLYLDLAMVTGLNAESFGVVIRNCKRLRHLNLSWCHLNAETVEMICKDLHHSLTHINLSGTENKRSISDEDIGNLCYRCPYLEEIDISDNISVTDEALAHLAKMRNLRILSLNRCYEITPMNFLQLNFLDNLNVIGCLTTDGENALKDALPNTEVCEQYFNYIAKPTAPPHVSSIWTQRTKEDY